MYYLIDWNSRKVIFMHSSLRAVYKFINNTFAPGYSIREAGMEITRSVYKFT